MTFEIILIFALLATVLLLFLTGWMRMDIVALLVIVVLGLSGLLSPEEALSGFSNPAVITVWAMFILSATLYQTGVAQIIGKQLLYITGYSDRRMITIIMVSSGLLSTIINNIGVAALMLPVVMDMARSTGKSPSRLLIPLAFGCHLGGLTTLIGTPPNLLISFALEDQGFEPFSMFDFSPLGFSAMAGGILFMALVGSKMLPGRKKAGKTDQNQKLASDSYSLSERIFILQIKAQSDLVGKTLEKSRLRAALGLNVLSIKREGENILAPGPGTVLKANDKLFVLGRIEAIEILRKWNISKQKNTRDEIAALLTQPLNIFEARLSEKTYFRGKHILDLDFPQRLDINVLALKTGTGIKRSLLGEYRFQGDEQLLLQGRPEQIEILREQGDIDSCKPVTSDKLINDYRLHEVCFIMELSDDTHLFDKETAENEIGTAFGLTVMAVINDDGSIHLPQSYEQLKGGDRILFRGNRKDLALVRALGDIDVYEMDDDGLPQLENDDIQLAEAVLAPRSSLEGKTLREMSFRKRYGVNVLAIWREGRAFRTNLHNIPLKFGEALLLYGKRETMQMLGNDSELILLTRMPRTLVKKRKAFTSILIMIAMLTPVVLGWVSIAIAAVLGVAMMVLTRCIRMEDAYKSIEWRSVFLIAGMLPLGLAIESTGAADILAQGVVTVAGPWGPMGLVAGLYLLTIFTTLAIPPPAMVVVMSPIALRIAENFQISPEPLMMTIAIAAAGTFMSPVSHAANLLVMGPGGYRFMDFFKIGFPLSMLILAIIMVLMPWVFPF